MADNLENLTSNQSRSRSHTPFLLRSSCDKEVCSITSNQHHQHHESTQEYHERKSVLRSSSKRTTPTSIKSSSEVRRSQRLENRKNIPYQSIVEDSDIDSDNSTISHYSTNSVNVVNGNSDNRIQEPIPLITMSTESADGNDKLKVYLESREYWNEYPKTGYTYVDGSSDLMPNMSRRPISRTPTPQRTVNTNQQLNIRYKTPTVNKGTETVEFDRIALNKSHQTRSILKSPTKSSVISRLVNFFSAIFGTIFSIFGPFLKLSYWYLVLWIMLDMLLLRRRNTVGNRRNVWKTLFGVIFFNAALISGWFVYQQLDSLVIPSFDPATSILPEFAHYNPFRVSDSNREKPPLPHPETTPKPKQLSKDGGGELEYNMKLLKADSQRMRNELHELKYNFVTLINDFEAMKTSLNSTNTYLTSIKNYFTTAMNELHKNGTEFQANITRGLDKMVNDVTDHTVQRVLKEFSRREISENGTTNQGHLNPETIKRDPDMSGARINYALRNYGSRVISIGCTQPYVSQKHYVLNFFSWTDVYRPDVVLNYRMEPGDCFAFIGFPGMLVIELVKSIPITEIGLEHISRDVALNPSTTPNHFTVFGLDSESDLNGFELGSFVYDINGPELQIFPIKNQIDKQFKIVQLIINSNYGHDQYTCLYRFRVYSL